MIICIKLNNKDITEGQVIKLLEPFGKVNSATVSLNCAYVHMSNSQEANAAIDTLDGSVFNDRTIQVKKAYRPLSSRINISNQIGLTRLL